GPAARRAIPALTKVMQDKDSYSTWTKFVDGPMSTDCIICHAASALIKIGKDSVPSLENIIDDSACNRIVREVAIQALNSLGSRAERAIPTLCKAVADKDEGVRLEALKALVSIGPRTQGKRAVLAATADESGHVRIIAAYALHQIDPDNIV